MPLGKIGSSEKLKILLCYLSFLSNVYLSTILLTGCGQEYGKGRGKNYIPSELQNGKVGAMSLVFTFARITEGPNWRLLDGMGCVQVNDS